METDGEIVRQIFKQEKGINSRLRVSIPIAFLLLVFIILLLATVLSRFFFKSFYSSYKPFLYTSYLVTAFCVGIFIRLEQRVPLRILKKIADHPELSVEYKQKVRSLCGAAKTTKTVTLSSLLELAED